MSRAIAQLDTCIDVVTPENIAFRYRVAGPFWRFLAFLLDAIFCAVFLFAAQMFLGLALTGLGAPEIAFAILMFLEFLVVFFYGGVFEALWNGQTLGKRILHLRVVTVEGLPIHGWQAMLRHVLRILDLQPICFGLVGLVAAGLTARFQRLGDLAAGTMVIIEERSWLEGVLRLDDPNVARLAATLPADFLPSRSLARALAVYVQRRANFSLGRRQEIARHLAAPLADRLGIAPGANADLLLCALYHRVFVTEQGEMSERGASPFRADDSGDDGSVNEWLSSLSLATAGEAS